MYRLLFGLLALTQCVIGNILVNTQVDRHIDISTHLVEIVSHVTIQNQGRPAVTEYTVQFGDPDHDDALSYMTVNVIAPDRKIPLKLLRTDRSGEFASYVYQLLPLAAQEVMKLEIDATFTHMLTPFPEVITQAEKQLVLYEDRLYFPTPYVTQKQSTKIKIASGSGLESYTKVRAVTVADKTITYGPFLNIPATKNAPVAPEEELRIHSENSSPFLTVSSLERSVQVSHWTGSVQVTETVDVNHSGAKLDGVFSRYDFQRDPTGASSAVKNWRTKLPQGAEHIFYRDEIGNISTSNVRKMLNQVAVDIRPRFPLFGGWKTQYMIGYTIPSNNVFFASKTNPNEYVLEVPLVDHIFDNMVIDDATVKIILPEFATNLRIDLPYSAERRADEVHYSYFDTVGRPVIVLNKKNIVDWHIQKVVVRYNFSPIYMLHEPLLVMGSIFGLCLFVIVLVRTRTNLDGK